MMETQPQTYRTTFWRLKAITRGHYISIIVSIEPRIPFSRTEISVCNAPQVSKPCNRHIIVMGGGQDPALCWIFGLEL